MFSFFQKIIAWFLIGLLFFEATFRVPFLLEEASALEARNNEDIVSLLVEEELMKKMSSDIDTYARRIQSQLPNTRTVILTYPKSAHPFLIASANERIYNSGLPNHGSKTQKLVGTILIGHVPIPVVHKDGRDFLSLYPYTDFSDPHFFWSWDTNRYEYIGTKPDKTEPDIWHSVIDPNSGNLEQDAQKIRDFFARVYEYDAKKGRYQDVGKDPQVLYMDSIQESRAISKGLLAVYEKLHIPQQEHLLYHRYTREFAQYFYDTYLSLMNSDGTASVVSFPQWKKKTDSTSGFLNTAADITTKIFADELIVPFLKTINEKYLGDIARLVHNTGRYYNGYSDVRMDTIPEVMSQKDALSGKIIKELNDTLEKMVDSYVDANMAMDIPLLLYRPGQKTITEKQTYESGGRTLTRSVNRTFSFTYDNYFYGKKASEITDATECSLIAGSTFGGYNTKTEINHGYSMTDATEDSKVLNKDTSAGIICKKPTQSYWGGNSPINTEYVNGEVVLGQHRYDDFSLPIRDLSAAKKTTTPVGSPLDCLKRDFILKPYKHIGIDGKTLYPWPVETGGERYSCATDFAAQTPYPIFLEPSPEGSENILTNLVSCPPAPNSVTNVSLLSRTGAAFATCQTNGLTGTYKLISSLVKHSDPSSKIYGEQLKGISSPNIPIDEERYVSYLDRSGREGRVTYPNLFDINILPNDSDAIIIQKITTLLDASTTNLKPGADFATTHPWKKLIKFTNAAPRFADVLLTNPDVKAGLIDALRWKNLDTEAKYARAFDLALSKINTNSKLLIPDKKSIYEIAYMGGSGDARDFVFGFSPEDKTALPDWFENIQAMQEGSASQANGNVSDSNSEFSLSNSEIASLLGDAVSTETSEDGAADAGEEGAGESTFECGDPEGVVIWEWLSAIQCWLDSLFDTKWTTPDIDDIGFPELPSLTVTFGGDVLWTTKEIEDIDSSDDNNNGVVDYVEENANSLSLNNTFSDTVIPVNQTIRVDAALESATSLINDDASRVELVVTQLDDLDTKKTYLPTDANWTTILPQYIYVTGSSVLKDGHAVWVVEARNNHRSRVYIESRIYSSKNVFLRSEKSIVLVGPDVIPFTVVSSSGLTSSETIEAGDKNGINLILSETKTPLTRVNVEIRDYITGKNYASLKGISVNQNRVQILPSSIDTLIKRAGKYTLSLESGELAGEANFTISPAKPDHITTQLSSILLKDKTQLFTLKVVDIYGNEIPLTQWDMKAKASLPITLSGFSASSSREFQGKVVNNTMSLVPKESGNMTLDITLSSGTTTLSTSLSRPVLSEVKLVVDIQNRNSIQVGQDVSVNISVQRADGTIVDTWDIPLTLGIKGGNAKLTQTKITFEKGKATTRINTGTRSGKAQIYIQDTSFGSLVGDAFDILPGDPTQLSLDGPSILYARAGAQDTITLQLRDKYGNFTDLRSYGWHIETTNPDILEPIPYPIQTTLGTSTTRITSRGLPGRILMRAWLTKDGNKTSISTLENVLQFSVLPVLTSDDAGRNTWQTITQVLLGGIFGQTPVQGYFAGSALFAPETKMLAVSTLIDNPKTPILTITPSGNINLGSIKYGTGLDVRIENFRENVLSLIVQDNRLGDIARVTYPPMGTDASTALCSKDETDVSCDKDTFAFLPVATNTTVKNGVIYQNNQPLFPVRDILSLPNLRFTFLSQTGSSLQFAVTKDSLDFGILALRWKSRAPSTDTLNNTTYNLAMMVAGLEMKMNWNQTSSYDIPGIVVYDRDESPAYLGGANEEGWSAYPKKQGIGWTDDNTSLLQFASGQEWSSSQKNTADYLTINLGDPIIKLPAYKVHPLTGLDQTIGEPVYLGTSPVAGMTFRDINSDGTKDLIAFHDDGTVGTRLERGDGSVLDVGDLLSVSNARDGMIRSGDFVGDGYSDIVYVDNDDALRLVTHTQEGPNEQVIKYDTNPVLGSIEQLEVFDMDHDGIDDIIVMDSIGSLYIFYGKQNGIFVVQFVENVYDFVLGSNPKTSYFVGAVRWDGQGYKDPRNIKKSTDLALLSKQSIIEQTLFTDIKLPKTTTTTPVVSAGTNVYNTLNTDSSGFLRMYDGDGAALGNNLQAGFDAIQEKNSGAVSVVGADDNYETFPLLRAPFVNPKNLLITKKYTSLESGDTLVSGSPIEVTLELKNTSSSNISGVIIQEKIPSFLEVSDMKYDLFEGTTQTVGSFISSGDSLIADVRGKTLRAGQSLRIVYRGTLKSFSFGTFDVGYLEDKNDPNSNNSIPKEKIRSIDAKASTLSSIPERDFHGHDVYGDIRFNPNETCGGPLLLWRSHNDFSRTYHKTLIVRDIKDPDKAALEASKNTASLVGSSTSSSSSGATGSTSSTTDSASLADTAMSDLATWQADGDSDGIPDRGDDDNGDVFEVSTSGNSTQISIGLGKVDDVLDDIIGGVKEFLSGLSCGFGDAGCISMPINWAANIPGNTITALGFALPGANQPPIACYDDVRCGYPIFSAPTISCAACEYECAEWPPCSEGAGGGFDYYGGSVGGTSAPAGYYMPGLGISEFRIFIGATLTGAIAEVMCFGPNDAISNLPGMFPIRFDGNCIFATQPLTQCEDDGSSEDPLVTESDIASEINGDNADDGNGNNSGNSFTNADSCSFYEPLNSYPVDLSQSVSQYLSQSTDANASNLEAAISNHSDVITDTTGSTDSGLYLATSSPDDSYSRLNGVRGLSFDSSGSGTGMLQISLDSTKLNLRDFGKVLDINLRSIKAFPNFIMDWYHRQMDEIMASIGHLPDIKIFLPDLSSLADTGWMGSFGSDLKNAVTGGSSRATATGTTTAGTTTAGTTTAGTTTAGTTTAGTTTAGTTTAGTTSSQSTLKNASNAIRKGWNSTFGFVSDGFNAVGGTISKGLGYADTAKNAATSFIQEKTTGIQNAFEYIGTLPIIDVHPQTISFEIPWIGKQEAQAWLVRNQAVLDAWKNLPQGAVNSINTGPLISSIQTNIEIVRSYMDLPEKLQNLFYIKEKILYGIVQNIQAVQSLMGGWLYDNGLRFKAWVEVYILVTKLWDLWQVLVDVFNDYEAECGVCRNERWNLQHWLWIIISIIIPPIPVIQMPRWPDIELDFSDIDLSLDIAYPVFNLSFYPVSLPDAPIPTISGFNVSPMPLLPRLPDLNIDINIPVIQLPKLPDLPPPPKIPELSQAITIVLKIFKLIVLIMCLYRKVPLSPEWFVGTKVAHKTERQGYLPFDFLDYGLPTVSMEWLDAIRVSTHVKLKYDVDYITDALKSALEPFTNFPRNLFRQGTSNSSTVNIDINPDTGVKVETTSDISSLPELIAQLYRPDIAPAVSIKDAEEKLGTMVSSLDIPAARKTQLLSLINTKAPEFSTNGVQEKFEDRFSQIHLALAKDIEENTLVMKDIAAWREGKKKPEEIAFIRQGLPNMPHLAQSEARLSHFLSLTSTVLNPLASLTQNSITPDIASTIAVTPTPDVVAAPGTQNTFSDKAPDVSGLARTRGLYVTQGTTTQRLIDYTEVLDGETQIYAIDDDKDGDQDVYYSLGDTIYRKENYMKTASKYYISDAPKIYNVSDIYSEFFGLKTQTIENIPYDGQTHISRGNTYGRMDLKFLVRSANNHMKLFLFNSLMKRDNKDADRIVDIVPKDTIDVVKNTVQSVPHIISSEGKTTLKNNDIYRTLISGQRYIDAEGKLQNLSADFVIRSGQSGYAKEPTTLRVSKNGISRNYALRLGQRMIFGEDSNVSVVRGSLILFGSSTTVQGIDVSDRGFPVLPGDEITTGDNGKVVIAFPDGTQTVLTQNQSWSLTEYTPTVGIQNISLNVEPQWHYASLEDTRSVQEMRLPYHTIFDAYTRVSDGAIVAQIPREISLDVDKPTEVDFQQYFPTDIISQVEVFRLASSEWRRVSPTKVAFEMQKQRTEILVRVTVNGFVRDYTTTLVTKIPKLAIDSIDTNRNVTGTLSSTIISPIGIQSFLGNKSWTLNSGVSVQDKTFSASFTNVVPSFDISSGSTNLLTMNRNTGAITLNAGTSMLPNIIVGRSLGVTISDTQGQKLQMNYRMEKVKFYQVSSLPDITNSGMYIIGNGLRLEPATILDTTLPGGVYITDTSYRPLIAFDANGVLRYLDTNIKWSATSESGNIIFTIKSNGAELGKIVLRGETVTSWQGK